MKDGISIDLDGGAFKRRFGEKIKSLDSRHLEMDSRRLEDWSEVRSKEERAVEDDSRRVSWATGWVVESCTKPGRGSSLHLEDGRFAFRHTELRYTQS